jgi:hypothetical protein
MLIRKSQQVARLTGLILGVFLCAALSLLPFPARAAPPAMVVTLTVTFPAKDSADAWGMVMLNDPKDSITDRGFCWSTTPSPSKNCGSAGSGVGFFGLPLSGIKSGYTFYVRAYAVTSAGTTFGNQVSFTLPPPFIPEAVTADPAPTGSTTAVLGGEVTREGHAPVLDRGVCWATQPLPDFHDNCRSMGSGLGSFSREIDGFTPGVIYYVRAYGESDIGTGWGQDKAFSTNDPAHDLPTVTTTAPYGETDVSALSGGYVTHGGDTPVTACGVCWSTSPGPTVNDSHTADGSGLGQFHSAITGLDPLTEYYVRAYAVNSAGTGYGAEYKFTTVHPTYPSVGTVGIVEIYDDSALVSGEVVLTGDATADERGFCWSQTPQPLVSDNTALAEGSGAGMFQVMLTGLRPETVYYARAYAKNPYGVFYGHIIHFKTMFSKYPAR